MHNFKNILKRWISINQCFILCLFTSRWYQTTTKRKKETSFRRQTWFGLLFLMRSYFSHGCRVQKECAPAKRTSSLAITALVLARTLFLNAAETRFSWAKMAESSAWNLFFRRLSVSLCSSAAVTKTKKIPAQKFLPACHEAYPCLVPSEKGSEFFFAPFANRTFHASLAVDLTESDMLRATPTES